MAEFVPLLAVRQLHLQPAFGVLYEERERAVIAVRAAPCDGLVHLAGADVLQLVILQVQRPELAFVEAHLLMAILGGAFCVVLGFVLLDDQWRIIKQSVDGE